LRVSELKRKRGGLMETGSHSNDKAQDGTDLNSGTSATDLFRPMKSTMFKFPSGGFPTGTEGGFGGDEV